MAAIVVGQSSDFLAGYGIGVCVQANWKDGRLWQSSENALWGYNELLAVVEIQAAGFRPRELADWILDREIHRPASAGSQSALCDQAGDRKPFAVREAIIVHSNEH